MKSGIDFSVEISSNLIRWGCLYMTQNIIRHTSRKLIAPDQNLESGSFIYGNLFNQLTVGTFEPNVNKGKRSG